MLNINPTIFHAYDVRGIYPKEITEEAAYAIGRGFAKYLINDLKKALPFSVVLGQDMRGSSPFLAREVVRGINDEGVDVTDIGRVPTPAFYHAVAFKDFAGGVMVTASHNPKEYNGFKFCAEKAAPIGEGTGLERIREYSGVESETKLSNKARGHLSTLGGVVAEYVARDLSFADLKTIKKLKIAADPANAMGAVYLEELFGKIDCDPIKINWQLNGNMPIHEANPLKIETLQQIQEVIRNERADFGIATDGDGDRIVFLDEKGQVMPPYIILGLVAQALLKKYPGARIGYDLRSSRVVKEMIEAAGGEAVETKVGHSNIKVLMKEKDILFAGELSSHYYFKENYNFESPVFVTAQLLAIRYELDRPFSEIWEPRKKYAQSGEINFDVADKDAVLAKLEKKYADGTISKPDGLKVDYQDWWFSARPSNTENVLRLNLEAADETAVKRKVEELRALIVGEKNTER
ncbi:MAG: phosphomannomutase/phosphoglucomutase [Candidatus Doudnabacteria bacterium]|nr:phosphomannomutase/phosphoglucomutase [bacterium]MDZ4243492.1 phosphomannomutase/phosphoglucomutase [Candidatus Doudnabacteria bacterium]